MEDLIGNAPGPALLILMSIPLTLALALGGYIAISFRRRGQKSQMKLGITPKLPTSSKPEARPKETSAITLSPSSLADPGLNMEFLNKPSTTKKENTSMSDRFPESDPAPIDLAARLGQSASPPPTPLKVSTGPVELLRLLRDPESGQLIIEVAGQQYSKLADVTDKKIGHYILKLAANFLAFTNGVILTDAGMKSLSISKVNEVPEPILASSGVNPVPQTPSPPAVAAASTETSPAKVPPDVEAAFLSSLRTGSLSEVSPAPKPAGFFSRVKQPTPVSPLPGLNLAEEINEIVQAHLRYSPLASNRIAISGDPKGGIRIQVNDSFYSSPDEIEDPEIKDLIKASIKEWERK